MPIAIHDHLADAVASYDGVILDVWGCLHEGGPVFAEARNCLERMAVLGKPVVLLSNAPRRAERVEAALAERGLERSLYGGIVTSGDAVHAALAAGEIAWIAALGRRAFHIGPRRDAGLLDGLAYEETESVESADFILCTGLDGPEDTVADYEADLAAGATRRLPLVCANPDRTVIREGRVELCAGTLAARYGKLGGTVHDFGKPYPAVYELCLAELAIADRDRVLCIGDGLETDIRGAVNTGLDSLLVTGGLLASRLSTPCHAPPRADELEAICEAGGIRPNAAIARLFW